MRQPIPRLLRLLIAVVLLIGLVPVQAVFAQDAPAGEVVAEGFNGPMGVLVDPNGDVWVIESGLGGDNEMEGMDFDGNPVTINYGPSARIVQISMADGSQTDVAALTSVNNGTENEGGSRLALLDGTLYATGPGWHPAVAPATAEEPVPGTGGLYAVGADGSLSEVYPLWELERDNNPVSAEVDNHPYGLLAGPDGNLWVADAGMNALLKVDPAGGEATIVATFDPIPGVFPNPNYDGEMLTDAVPTGVAVADGQIYVSYLSGGPFIPGSAKVVAVAEDGTVSDYATGLTMLTDLRTGPDGDLYAVQFGMFTEQGPVPGSGAILRIHEGDASEVLVPGLMFPTSLDFNAEGDMFVTVNGVGAPGSGQVVKFAGLTEMAGMPIGEMMAAMGPPAEEAAPAEEGAMAEQMVTEESAATEEMAGEEGVMAADIVDTAVAAGDFNTLVAAVQAAGLVETLKGEGPFTVFAPTDAAFAPLAEDGTVDALLADPEGQLKDILLYHVISGKVMASDLSDGLEATTVQGSPVVFTLGDGVAMVNDANIVVTDIETSNGVIHVIDGVIVPPTEEAAMADEKPAEATPEMMPTTGLAGNSGLPVLVVGLTLAMLVGGAFVTRRRER